MQTLGVGPHREGTGRPDWFYEKEFFGGILCDIGSHQIEQFLFYTGNSDARVVASQVRNVNHPQYPQFEDFGDAMLAALPADGRLPGRFDADWKPTVKWSCLTGDCQLGINWGRLFQITGDARYRDATARILGFVKKTQLLADKEEARIGGIKGSHPINGGYHPWQYPNWATKFYADALMMDSANRQGALYK